MNSSIHPPTAPQSGPGKQAMESQVASRTKSLGKADAELGMKSQERVAKMSLKRGVIDPWQRINGILRASNKRRMRGDGKRKIQNRVICSPDVAIHQA